MIRLVALLLAVLSLAGCTTSGGAKDAPLALPVHVVHHYDQDPAPTRFEVPHDAGTLHVALYLANTRKGFCPGPSAQLTLLDPNGTQVARLESQQLPTFDCEYRWEQNETFAPGIWTVQYTGGSAYLGSTVDVAKVS